MSRMKQFIKKFSFIEMLLLLAFSCFTALSSAQNTNNSNPKQSAIQLLDEAKAAVYGDSAQFFNAISLAIQFTEAHKDFLHKSEAFRLAGVYYYLRAQYAPALLYYQKSLRLAQEHSLPRQEALAINNQGIIYELQGVYDSALVLYERAYIILLKAKDSLQLTKPLNNSGNVYYALGDYENALKFYEQVRNLEQHRPNETGLMMSYNNIGNVNYELKNYHDALNNYNEAARLAELNKLPAYASMAYSNIGLIYKEKGDYQAALDYYNRSLETDYDANLTENLIVDYNNIASIYLAQNKLELAHLFLMKATEQNKKLNNPVYKATTQSNFGKYYLKQNKTQKALQEFERAYDHAKRSNLSDQQSEIAFTIASLLEAKGNYKNAIAYFKEAKSLKDSIFSERNKRIISGLNLKYTHIKDSAENALLRKNSEIQEISLAHQKRNNVYLIGALIIICILVIILVYSIIKIHKAKNRLEKQKLQLEKNTNILAISEHKYRTIIEQSRDIIYIIKKRKLVFVNDPVERVLGYSSEELKNKSIFELIHPQDKRSFLLDYRNAFSMPDEKISMTFRLLHKNGKIIHAENTLGYLKLKNGDRLIIGNLRDITERIQTMEALQASESKLQQLNRSKDMFFSIISHDLRSPFNAILGYAELLKSGSLEQNTEQTKEIINKLHSASNSTYHFLENLLEWSASQTNKSEMEMCFNDVRQSVSSAIEALNASILKKRIIIQHDIPPDTIAYYNDQMLITVVRNLISNAVKYSHENSIIRIQSKIKTNGFIQVEVIDNGVGMSDEQAKYVFEIKRKVQTRGTDREQGSGLGLLICKEFIEKQGGQIFFKTEEGAGSIFSFTLAPSPDKINI